MSVARNGHVAIPLLGAGNSSRASASRCQAVAFNRQLKFSIESQSAVALHSVDPAGVPRSEREGVFDCRPKASFHELLAGETFSGSSANASVHPLATVFCPFQMT